MHEGFNHQLAIAVGMSGGGKLGMTQAITRTQLNKGRQHSTLKQIYSHVA
jgi:hypothetical protein